MRSQIVSAIIFLVALSIPASAAAAPRTYIWGQLAGTDGIYFHKQASDISWFNVTLPVHCDYIDGTSSIVSTRISGPEVPNLYVERNGQVHAEFSVWAEGLLTEADVAVEARFRGNRAVIAVIVSVSNAEENCTGAIIFDRVRRGARVR